MPPSSETLARKPGNIARAKQAAAIERRGAIRKANLAQLRQMFPAMFDPACPLPRAIVIDRAVRAFLGVPYSEKEVVPVRWTRTSEYWRAVAAARGVWHTRRDDHRCGQRRASRDRDHATHGT
jgi:hypothetical protein